MLKIYTTEEFIEKAIEVKRGGYNYSLSEYKGLYEKIKIICPLHGIFNQTPYAHIHLNNGCVKCNIKKSAKARRLNSASFIEKARIKFGEKYQYHLVKYELNNKKVSIICPIHGEFLQTPNNHLTSKFGCIDCSKKSRGLKIKIREDFSHITPPKDSRIIPLTKGKYALVDEEDYERVSQYSWYCLKTNDYAVNNKVGSMHRFIMGLEKNDKRVIDHKYHNTLDNRKSQLRICTYQENARNKRKIKNKSSIFIGVSFKSHNKWSASIMSKYFGTFNTEEEAARAYDAKAIELFGEFACLNFKE